VLPELVPVFASALKEAGVTKLRCSHEDLSIYEHFAASPSKKFYETVSAQSAVARVVYEQHGFKFPDVSFVCLLSPAFSLKTFPHPAEVCWKWSYGAK
jgi:hypothetical protein